MQGSRGEREKLLCKYEPLLEKNKKGNILPVLTPLAVQNAVAYALKNDNQDALLLVRISNETQMPLAARFRTSLTMGTLPTGFLAWLSVLQGDIISPERMAGTYLSLSAALFTTFACEYYVAKKLFLKVLRRVGPLFEKKPPI